MRRQIYTKKLQVSLTLSQHHQLDEMVRNGYAETRNAVIRRLLRDYQKEKENNENE